MNVESSGSSVWHALKKIKYVLCSQRWVAIRVVFGGTVHWQVGGPSSAQYGLSIAFLGHFPRGQTFPPPFLLL